ncbi:hypothetical protein PtA15_7A533 [Puccinia triticina]|uniref:Uncharacterized protein n=1 Tax=Puccinia triticina TaxID=208348 RepID=A0ABY7CNI3_9BASI|nr:uncharacterized protein PtA15_7A533 [Puccinia triticina]WAQ86804.1 hypothetical protein PtA15_7A533 [Puccinia triticina]
MSLPQRGVYLPPILEPNGRWEGSVAGLGDDSLTFALIIQCRTFRFPCYCTRPSRLCLPHPQGSRRPRRRNRGYQSMNLVQPTPLDHSAPPYRTRVPPPPTGTPADVPRRPQLALDHAPTHANKRSLPCPLAAAPDAILRPTPPLAERRQRGPIL